MRNRLLLAALVLPLVLATACGEEDSSVADDPASSPTESATSTPAPVETPSDPASESPSQAPPDSAPPTSAEPEPTGPACRTVWVDGRTLPKRYAGCVAGGEFVEADRLGCSSGQRIVRYDDRFWAYEGGPVSRTAGLLKDDEYVDEVATCRG